MRLHLLGLPHTITRSDFSHCAYTGKVKRFGPMMRSVGYEVVHYGVAGSESGANEQVDVLQLDEWRGLGGRMPGKEFYGALANVETPLYRTFNQRLRALLRERVAPQDIICLPFGHGHEEAIQGLDHITQVETGIGYPKVISKFRVYESHAWRHWHYGSERQSVGSDYHWVIPNYFDLNEWPMGWGEGRYLLYFGRIVPDKGLWDIWEVAKARPDLHFVLCGQGDPTPWLTLPNIEYRPPVHGSGRAKIIGDAMAVLMPTKYLEPFGGVAVEAQLCGTPVLASGYGAFPEIIRHQTSGFICHTLGDYLAAIERLESWVGHRSQISYYARKRYDMYELAKNYDEVFRKLNDLWGKGWYTLRSHIGPIQKVDA